MLNLTVIGDDLTGTVDAVSLGVRSGASAREIIGPNCLIIPPDPLKKEVLGINTSSRTLSGIDAYQIVKKVTIQVAKGPEQIILKKMDTGFRGNAAYEIEGMLDALNKKLCFILEHIPIRKTFTLYGYQFSAGQLLEKSVFSRDDLLKAPKESYIPSILSKDTNIPIGTVNIDAVKSNHIIEATKEQIRKGKKIIVFDVITTEDGHNIVNQLQPIYPDVLWAGTTGVIEAVINYLYGPQVNKELIIPQKKTICFSGTAYQATKEQINYAQKYSNLKVYNLDIGRVLKGDKNVFEEILNKSLRENSLGKNILIRQKVPKQYETPGIEHKIEASLCKIAEMLTQKADFEQILVIGGETSQAIFSTLGVQTLELFDPIIIGCGRGRFTDGPLRGKYFAIKGGSIGSASVLLDLLGIKAGSI
ncbi:four-carbon acid sugar kinase family protein [Acidaminococcus massiliensis]|uniref:four-carbon acid sugar kinase family protein n=1 Tax=Acidaminococcus massiliensis TaxID=1852375 RepID=UPI00094EAB09|nr:four-carbon acid sugar kinase family protein [Acidaminococcus massiliensis]